MAGETQCLWCGKIGGDHTHCEANQKRAKEALMRLDAIKRAKPRGPGVSASVADKAYYNNVPEPDEWRKWRAESECHTCWDTGTLVTVHLEPVTRRVACGDCQPKGPGVKR